MTFKLYRPTRWLILFMIITTIYFAAVIFSKSGIIIFDTTPKHPFASAGPPGAPPAAIVTPAPAATIYVAVVIALSKQTSHIAEFHLLYDSWRFIQNFSPLSQEVLVDLIIFCEQPSCLQLPSACLPLSYYKKVGSISKCYYEELYPEIVKEWTNYLYMTSIAFMLTKEFQAVAFNYQWILRVDQDAVLSPGLLLGVKEKHPIKLYEMQFGGIGHGIEFTHNRVKQIAKKLGYQHGGIHDLCSTWLVHPQDAITLANLTTKIGKHFLRHEYGKNVSGIEDLPYIGEWPKWWLGVTSLYAAEIAINHLYFSKLGHQHESSAIDHSADSDQSVWNAWHIHCLHNPTEFAKFRHRDKLREFLKISQLTRNEKVLNMTTTQLVLKNVYDEFNHLQIKDGKFTGKVAVRDYVTALAWQKAYAATGAVNLDH